MILGFENSKRNGGQLFYEIQQREREIYIRLNSYLKFLGKLSEKPQKRAQYQNFGRPAESISRKFSGWLLEMIQRVLRMVISPPKTLMLIGNEFQETWDESCGVNLQWQSTGGTGVPSEVLC